MRYDDDEEIEIIDAFEDIEVKPHVVPPKEIKKEVEKTKEVKKPKEEKKAKEIITKNSLLTSSIILLPIFSLIFTISTHSNDLINVRIGTFSLIMMIILSILFLVGFVKEIKSKRNIFIKAFKGLGAVSYASVFILTGVMLYGENGTVRDFIIDKAMKTTSHQYIATWLFDRRTIDDSLAKLKEMTLTDVDVSERIEFENLNYNDSIYTNQYEEAVLTKENEDDVYKIINIEGKTIGSKRDYKGYLVVVYDPSKVKIATSKGAGVENGSYGETLATIAKKNNAEIAMNAGGFYDPFWNSNGGIPHGLVIKDGVIQSEFRRGMDNGGLIGFNNENQLVLKQMTAEEAVAEGIRDAVDWGPFLIVNGKNNYAKVKSATWATSRTAIGQRADGIVLMLVIDGGNQPGSYGASYADVAKIMANYGAINAANLDGGTSTALVKDGEYVNNPWNGSKRTIRRLPNAWIIEK